MICVPSFTLIENFLTDERRADGGGAGLTNLERWGPGSGEERRGCHIIAHLPSEKMSHDGKVETRQIRDIFRR